MHLGSTREMLLLLTTHPDWHDTLMDTDSQEQVVIAFYIVCGLCETLEY